MDGEVFIRKLETFGSLSENDRSCVQELTSNRKTLLAGRPFAQAHEAQDSIHIVISGMACRYKALYDSKRQISAFLIPGDICDAHTLILKSPDHSIATLCATTVAEVTRTQFNALLERPAVGRALLFASLVDQSILREWVGNIGRRTAVQRMAHLFYETYIRLRLVQMNLNHTIELPLTQSDLADCLGLSLVHTNKSLRQLREGGLVTFQQGILRLLDVEGLQKLCGFSEAYLHLEGGKT